MDFRTMELDYIGRVIYESIRLFGRAKVNGAKFRATLTLYKDNDGVAERMTYAPATLSAYDMRKMITDARFELSQAGKNGP